MPIRPGETVSRSADAAADAAAAPAAAASHHHERNRQASEGAKWYPHAQRSASESGACDDNAADDDGASARRRRCAKNAAAAAAGQEDGDLANPARSTSQRRLLASRAGVALTIAPPTVDVVPSTSKAGGEDDGVCLLASPAPASFAAGGGQRSSAVGNSNSSNDAPVGFSPPPASTPSLIRMVDGDVVTRRPGRQLGGSRPLPPWMLEEEKKKRGEEEEEEKEEESKEAKAPAPSHANHPPRGTAAVFLSTDHALRRLAVGGNNSNVNQRPRQQQQQGQQQQQQHLHHLSAVSYANSHHQPPRFAAFGGDDTGTTEGATSPSKLGTHHQQQQQRRRSPSPPTRGAGGVGGAAAAFHVTATTHFLPAPRTPLRAALAAPLPTLTREIEARIQSLGTELPKTHRAILWAGVALDVSSKASAAAQLVRFAKDGSWVSFGSLAAFVALSSAAVTGYWLTHYYPGAFAERAARAARAKQSSRGNAGGLAMTTKNNSPSPPPHQREKSPGSILHHPKGAAAAAAATRAPSTTGGAAINSETDTSGSWAARRAWVRRAGTVAAALQLGTAFAAARALRASEVRQRAVAMELRGMRLADTVFLTLGVACLNAWAQVRCAAPGTPCAPGGGRAALRLVSVAGAVASAAMCHLALEMNDRRLAAGDGLHAAQLAALTVYRAAEAGARVALLAVFAGVCGAWLFAVLGFHAAATLLLLRLQPRRPKGDDCALAVGNGGNGAGSTLAPSHSSAMLGPRPWDKVFAPARAPGWWRRWLLRLSREREARKKRQAKKRQREQQQQEEQRLSPSPSPKDDAENKHASAFDRADAAVQAAATTLEGGREREEQVDVESDDNELDFVRTSAETDTTLLPRPPLPRTTDACLLAACLAWPPSFYVSDATDHRGHFWWRARMLGRRSCADVRPARALVPFWAYTLLVAAEAAVMLGVLVATAPAWAAPYVAGAQLAHAAWGLAAALWLAVEVASAAEGRDAALDRLAAGRDAEAMLQEMEAEAEAGAEAAAEDAEAERERKLLGVVKGAGAGGCAVVGMRKLPVFSQSGGAAEGQQEEEQDEPIKTSSSPSASPQRLLHSSEDAPLSSSCNAAETNAEGGSSSSPGKRRLASDSGVVDVSMLAAAAAAPLRRPPAALFPLRTSWGRRSSGSSGGGGGGR